jgi:hypothetical protein
MAAFSIFADTVQITSQLEPPYYCQRQVHRHVDLLHRATVRFGVTNLV